MPSVPNYPGTLSAMIAMTDHWVVCLLNNRLIQGLGKPSVVGPPPRTHYVPRALLEQK